MGIQKALRLLLLLLPLNTYATSAVDLFSAAAGGNQARVEALLAQGLDVNSATPGGRTALMGASFGGNARIVQTLLAYGADVNMADNTGTTALMDALIFSHENIVTLLITAGADVNAKDNQNITVLGRAKKVGNKRIIKILEQAEAQDTPQAEEAEPVAEGDEAGEGVVDKQEKPNE